MTKTASRQLLALAAVAGLIVVVVARHSDAPAEPAPAPSNSSRGSTPVVTRNSPVADVRLELLKNSQTELGPSTRNPFQFKPKAPPPSAVARAGGPSGRGGTGPGSTIVVGPPPPPPGPPPPPPILLKYIGELDTTQAKVAVFRDAGGEIINGKEGDIIDGRYRLLKIGVESVDLAYVDGRGRQTIRLSGQ